MVAFLVATDNIAFVSAIVLIALLGVLQAIGLGGDFGLDLDADADIDVDAGAGGIDMLGWLGIGRVPLSILLVVLMAMPKMTVSGTHSNA